MKKKLIEVALPLEAINEAAREEKSVPRRGHPQTLHYWWARRPLAACRAVLFASLVDDPSSHPDIFPTEKDQTVERQRLFRIIEQLVKWENSNNQRILDLAKTEILRSTDNNPPPVLDPFCGGGSIPLEAQRLGLEAHGSDLNPIPVLITKALIEIPPKFANKPPVNPDTRKKIGYKEGWQGSKGLAEDVRYYGKWIRDEAEKRIGHLYPKVKLPKEQGGGDATVIAWLWARTVKCPNPACGAQMPLVRSFAIAAKAGKKICVEPIVSGNQYNFEIKQGSEKQKQGTVNRKGATCICCNTPVPFDYIRNEGKAKRINAKLMAIMVEHQSGRIYLPPIEVQENIALRANPENAPDTDLPDQALGFRVQLYGMTKHKDLFSARQLSALITMNEMISEARVKVIADAREAGISDEMATLNEGGVGVQGYADAISVYLSCALSRLATYNNTICFWNIKGGSVAQIFARQAIPMSWDFIEINPLEKMSGNWLGGIEWVGDVLENLPCGIQAHVKQLDATASINGATSPLISTDPPYYDNIGYADLADFFYIWMRRSLGKVYPDIFSTLLVPKTQELVATPFRFGGDRGKAKAFFEEGLGKAFSRIREVHNEGYPFTVYYAFKQAETDSDADDTKDNNGYTASTGWETMLEGLLNSGFMITGTWPMRTERPGGVKATTNALASSILLACRQKPRNAPPTTRRDFLTALKRELPGALKSLYHGNIAPVDLAQASIGPGMAVFSRYSKVIEADGSPMKVRTALALINQTLDEVLVEQEGEFDSDTRWAVAWFDQFEVGCQ